MTKAAIKRAELRDNLWENAAEQIWDRKKEKGFITIPRTLPLVMTLIDELIPGKKASQVYFDLWCRVFDEGLVDASDDESLAFSSGYVTPGRNVRSWKERMAQLQELGFILVEPRGSKRYGHVLLRHPHIVVQELRKKKLINKNWWGAFINRVTEIGCHLPQMED